jgi:hypothetical protein
MAIGPIERSTVLLSTLNPTVAEKQRQSKRIVEGLRQLRLGEQLVEHRGQSRLHHLHQRCGSGAAGGKPLFGAQAAYLGLAGVDCLQPLVNVMPMVSAGTTTPSTARTFSSIDAGLIADMDPAQRTRLRNGIETHISEAPLPKSGRNGNTKRRLKKSRGS